MEAQPTLRVMALHALAYCERLFFLEEVEEIRVADQHVYAGRILHEQVCDEGEFVELQLESEQLGLRGRMDALRRRGGLLIPYEHKRGRSRQEHAGPSAWPSDRLQVGAYAMLLEEAQGEQVPEARIRYHADNALVQVPIDEALRADVHAAVSRARELAASVIRPPVTGEERRCARCSLAPVCLPEESRKALDEQRTVSRLFPRDDDRRVLHVMGHGTRVGRSGDELTITPLDGPKTTQPVRELRSVALHGFAGVSAQALQLCADHGIPVHWFGAGGWYQGTFFREDLAVQRRIRQHEALREPGFRLALARRLVHARAEGQLKFLLRASRGTEARSAALAAAIDGIRRVLPEVQRAERPEALLGLEGRAGAAYFTGLPEILASDTDPFLCPDGRTRRPPRDGFNAMIGFGYALLLRG